MNHGFGGKEALTVGILTARVVRKLKQGRREADDVINEGSSEQKKSEDQTRRGGGVHADNEETRTMEKSRSPYMKMKVTRPNQEKQRSPPGNYQSLHKHR